MKHVFVIETTHPIQEMNKHVEYEEDDSEQAEIAKAIEEALCLHEDVLVCSSVNQSDDGPLEIPNATKDHQEVIAK